MHHAINVASQNENAAIHILSTDTDVLILALAYFPRLGSNQCMLIGHGKNREIDCAETNLWCLRLPLVSALIDFHSFTECDTVGRFSDKGKITCWKSFKKADKTTVQGFIYLGQADIPSEATISALERYICQLYLPGTNSEDPGSVRWLLFNKNQAECEKLPPTKAALLEHILGANHQARIWHLESNTCPMDGQTRRVVFVL